MVVGQALAREAKIREQAAAQPGKVVDAHCHVVQRPRQPVHVEVGVRAKADHGRRPGEIDLAVGAVDDVRERLERVHWLQCRKARGWSGVRG